MDLSNEKIREYTNRLLKSRLRILVNHGFYGLLLMHMKFSIDDSCPTAATDGNRIFFNPGFLEKLSDTELDFIMMHEILHVVLQHMSRQGDRDQERFNIACDIVVNSNILKSNDMDPMSITLKKYGESMHLAPDGREGYELTAEEVYDMFPSSPRDGGQGESADGKIPGGRTCDDHSRWQDADGDGEDGDGEGLSELWTKRMIDAAESVKNRPGVGSIPLFAERLLKELRNPQIDWRTVLNSFVQEEIVDYSFCPPDRRFDDSWFYLPDFNDTDIKVKDILFMIDTSGSMSDEMITAAYSEVKGAIDQFDGKLNGWLGFFDAAVVEPKTFTSIDELNIIRPKGGGGTSFHAVFEYVRKSMADNLPASIIILTDGCAGFPSEDKTMGIPVLWLLNNETVNPPWGKVARITV